MNLSIFRTGVQLVDGLAGAPNPKPSAADKASFGRLASLYTAFSRDFASYVLDVCIRHGCTTIADPFSGMGTMAEAGRTMPIRLSLGDISPFAVLSGAFRAASQAEIVESARRIEEFTEAIAADDEQVFFSQLFTAAGAGTKETTAAALTAPTDPEFRATAFAIYLAALCRIRLHKRFAGSNPTWVKRANVIADHDATRLALTETLDAVRSFAARLPDVHPKNLTTARWASITDEPYGPDSLDAIVTSPPYPNRTDYIRHYLPASELLLAAAGRDERTLRSAQIGTPLIRNPCPAPALPASVLEILHQIRTHGSYASERYYYKGFLCYFADIADALSRANVWLRPGGLLIIVVQDTYYKDIHVPTANLLVELAQAAGFSPIGRRDWRVPQHLSRLSPHSRRSVPNRLLNESLIAFNK